MARTRYRAKQTGVRSKRTNEGHCGGGSCKRPESVRRFSSSATGGSVNLPNSICVRQRNERKNA